MNKYRNTDKDIHKRIYQFVVKCFKEVVKNIPKTKENLPIVKQISSSLTSMGANDQEADGASSSKDFIAKYMIVRKETKETKYWLSLIKDTSGLSESIINPHIQECHEIQMIVSKIIENCRNK
ncbi:MAG: four helix bundle protein [Patescibacteria group bacterium]